MIKGSGSNRQYIREADCIRVIGTSREENHAFITLARHFERAGLNVPHVISVSEDEMEYTQEDLGDTLLFDYIRQGRETGIFSEEEKRMLAKTIRALAHVQIEGARGLDWSVCYPVSDFDERSVRWDLNYFKYCFLKLTKMEFLESPLEDDFDTMVSRLLGSNSASDPTSNSVSALTPTFLYRDFQSRNVMIKGDIPYFIDFQGGRRGPVYYDIASFLWQAKANLPQSLREQLIDEYLDELKRFNDSPVQSAISPSRGAQPEGQFNKGFRETLHHFVLFRTLQVLGAYGYRGLFEGKAHFVESIPFAIKNLKELFAAHEALRQTYPYLYAISNNL